VSDVSQGPGWWQASDQQWYPPETHPDYQAPVDASPPSSEAEPAAYEEFQPGPSTPTWSGAHDEFGLAPASGPPEVSTGGPVPPPVAPPIEWVTPPSTSSGVGQDQWASQSGVHYTSAPAPKKRNLTPVISLFGIIIVAGVAALLFITLSRSNASASSVAHTVVRDFNAGKFSAICNVVEPSEQPKCASAMTQISGEHVTFTVKVGSTTVDGGKAIAVVTGSECVLGQCNSNTKNFDQLENGQTFSQLYAVALAGSSQGAEWLIPLVQIDGKWYASGVT
jgi:hypothetical protein